MEPQKKIAVINDLSGYGRCSLTVALPILSVMGHQCCPAPTAILSNHTEFPSFFCRDLTEELGPYTDEWAAQGLSFDGILTGFLGSAGQIAVVESIVEKLWKEGTRIIVDPVMGDNGALYPTCGEEICEEMKSLAGLADVVLPNVTEACMLTGLPYKEKGWTRKELLDMALRLRIMGAKAVVITGVREGDFFTNVVLEPGKDEVKFVRVKSAGPTRPGTGDVFAAVLSGAVLGGEGLTAAVKRAAQFVKDSIIKSDEMESPHLNGVCFEPILGKLIKK